MAAGTTPAYIDRMRQLGLFSACTPDELERLDTLLTEITVPAGRNLMHEGGAALEFVVVAEGIASVLVNDVEVARLAPGSFFGEHALLHDVPRNADVVASTAMRLYVLSLGEFTRLLKEFPSVAKVIEEADRARDDNG